MVALAECARIAERDEGTVCGAAFVAMLALMMAEAAIHRRKLKDIWDKHRPQRFYHGHYHVAHHTYYGPTEFFGLDRDATTLARNIAFLTADDLS